MTEPASEPMPDVAVLVGRYFDTHQALVLRWRGTPEDGIAAIRRRYIPDVLADPAAAWQIREWAAEHSPTPMTPQSPLDSLLGGGPEVACRVISEDIAVHWWPTLAKPGDPCMCGLTLKETPA